MSIKANPYTLSFGKQPPQMLSRYYETQNVIESFTDEPSPNQVFLISGVRGSGKTVMMTGIANELSKDDDWIVINLSPEYDLMESLAAELGERKKLKIDSNQPFSKEISNSKQNPFHQRFHIDSVIFFRNFCCENCPMN